MLGPIRTAISVSEQPSRLFAKQAGFTIVDEYYDAAVSGADPVDQRPGFGEMLRRLAANGAKTIIVSRPIGSPVTSPCSSPDMTC